MIWGQLQYTSHTGHFCTTIYVTTSKKNESLVEKFNFLYTTFLKLRNASFECKPQYNWISSYRVMKNLAMLKTIWNKGIWTLFLPIFQKQHPQHPTHSSWSCHIYCTMWFIWKVELIKVKKITENLFSCSCKIKGFWAYADVWTPVVYFYGINRIEIRWFSLNLQL